MDPAKVLYVVGALFGVAAVLYFARDHCLRALDHRSTTPNQDAVDSFEAAIECLVTNQETLDTLAAEGFDGDTIDAIADRIETAGTELALAEDYVLAHAEANRALVQHEAGSTLYESGEYSEARSAWETGRTHLTEALTLFEAVDDAQHGPQNFHDAIDKTGIMETLIAAFDKFIAGAEEAEAGNMEAANTFLGEGFELIEHA